MDKTKYHNSWWFLSLTHTGFLLDDLQYPLGGQQEVDEAAEAVSPVLPLHHTEELPQDGSSGDAEGSVQSRQGALDAAVQRLCVLREEEKEKMLDVCSICPTSIRENLCNRHNK